VSDAEEIVNAKIEAVQILYERDFILTVWVTLNYGGSCQGFGGYVLGGRPGSGAKCVAANDRGHLTSWINGVMACAGVDDFTKAKGNVVRVKRRGDWGRPVLAIGHATKNIWFDPKAEFVRLRPDTDISGASQ
jgi:hypothetical protein